MKDRQFVALFLIFLIKGAIAIGMGYLVSKAIVFMLVKQGYDVSIELLALIFTLASVTFFLGSKHIVKHL